jgi:hypothetical protein
MSNVIDSNPYILDTAADNIVPPTIKLHPKCILFSGAATAEDIAQIEDGNEAVKCVLSVAAAGESVPFYFPPNFTMAGLSLGALDSGKVYIYF